MDKPNYYQKNRDVLLSKSKEYYRNNREHIKNKYHNMIDEERQKFKEYQ